MDTQAAFLPQGYGTALASVALYWLLLGLPGFVVLRRWLPAALESGGLGAISLSYLASFAVLSPVSIACYLLHLPLWVMSAAIVLAVLGCAAALWQRPIDARITRPRFSAIALIACALIVADLVLGLRSGSNFGGDGRYHAARIRSLVDLGFNNWDPLVPGARFEDVYHTNLYHALIAASAHLTGIDPAAAWACAWFWAKLACAGAMYYLAWTVSGERWVAWVTAAAFALWMASNSILTYPNMLAAYWLMPLSWGFWVELRTAARTRAALAGLAAAAWVLPQVHALYYVFVCMLLGPSLLFGTRIWRRGPGVRRELVIALAVLALGAPWLGVTAWHRAHPVPAVVAPPGHPGPSDAAVASKYREADAKREAARSRGFIRLESGMLMLDPAIYLQPDGAQLRLLLLLGVAIATNKRRAQCVAIAGILLVVMAILYVPPLCTALSKLAGAPWIVRRLAAIPSVLYLALLPSAASLVLPQLFARPWLRGAWLCLALAYAGLKGVNTGQWQRGAYLERGFYGKRQFDALRGHALRRELFRRNVPAQAVIVAALEQAGQLGVDCNCYPLALSLDEPSHGVKDMDQRRADVLVMLDPAAPAEQRIALLRYHRVRQFWIRGYQRFVALNRAYKAWVVKVDKYNRDRVLTLDLKNGATRSPRPSPR